MLACNNIKLLYQKKVILDSITISFPKGLTCILGQNGAGKSTLIKVLSGQVDSYHGSVIIGGTDIKTMSIAEISKTVVMMNQSYEVVFDFTVEEVLKMGFHGLHFNDILYHKAVNMTNISHFLHRKYQTLSGGEKQRVQFARAIARLYATKSSILFLDEPSSSADIKQEYNMITIAKEIANAGHIVIMISHNIAIARRYANAVILLKNGKLQKYSSEVSDKEIMDCFDVGQDVVSTLNIVR
jgi:iron complex transport system ATP-binding protein